MSRQIRSGNGWRIGWDSAAEHFCALVSGETWSVELTASEFVDLCQGVHNLSNTMAEMVDQLMDAERLMCEQTTETIWIEAEGFPTEYGLRFILLTGRGAEGAWPAVVVPELLTALHDLTHFLKLNSSN
ncbi:MAG: DUF1818 family protein [Phormidesmis sp. RL_2_1]|nr:DUF1818 family protein [Phormidesmis sp. RL_2_1]